MAVSLWVLVLVDVMGAGWRGVKEWFFLRACREGVGCVVVVVGFCVSCVVKCFAEVLGCFETWCGVECKRFCIRGGSVEPGCMWRRRQWLRRVVVSRACERCFLARRCQAFSFCWWDG